MNIFENQVVLEGRSASSLAISGTAASTPVLEPGVYAVWSTVDAKIKVDVFASVAETVTIANGFPVTANTPVLPVRITRPAYLGAIAESAGTLYYHRVQ